MKQTYKEYFFEYKVDDEIFEDSVIACNIAQAKCLAKIYCVENNATVKHFERLLLKKTSQPLAENVDYYFVTKKLKNRSRRIAIKIY